MIWNKMQRSIFVALLLLVVSCGPDKGGNPAVRGTWQITIGGEEYDMGFDIAAAENGDYVVAGQTNSRGAGMSDAYLIRIDSMGNTLWEKTFGGAGYDLTKSLVTAPDGGLVAFGRTSSSGAGHSDFYLIKVTATGTLIWDQTYGGSGLEDGFCVRPVPGGGYLMAGSSGIYPQQDTYVVRVDDQGGLVWDRGIETASLSVATSILSDSIDEILIGGWAVNPETGGSWDALLVRLDTLGNIMSSKLYGIAGDDFCNAILRTPDDGFLLVGSTSSFGAGGQDMYVVKTDSEGNEEWSNTYGGAQSDGASAAVATADGGYVLAGWTESKGAGDVDVYLVKIDADGAILWERTFGGEDEDRAQAVIAAGDGGLVVVGWTESIGVGRTDVYIIKTNENGEL